MRKYFCSLILLFWNISLVQGENIPVFTHYRVQDGLYNESIKAIVKDQNGFIWIGTDHGISRFDGKNFKNYIHQEKDGLIVPLKLVSCLLLDRSHTLWATTFTGDLLAYDASKDIFIRKNNDCLKGINKDENFVTLVQDATSNFWLGTDSGLIRFSNTRPKRAVKYALCVDKGKPAPINTIVIEVRPANM